MSTQPVDDPDDTTPDDTTPDDSRATWVFDSAAVLDTNTLADKETL